MHLANSKLPYQPLVSVVMSVYNGERFLAEAVQSILKQSFNNFEFIIIDDGSTDSSPAILKSFQTADSRVLVHRQENRGLVESLNRGCSLAQGRYIVRMDADDIAVRDRLRLQIDFMEGHPEIGLLGGSIEYIDAEGRAFGTFHNPTGDQAIRSALYQASGSFCHPTTVMRKTVLASSGGYRKSFLDAEDYDLWLRMAEHSQLANLDEVVLKYRVHSGQVSQRKLAQQRLSILGAQEFALSSKTGEWDVLNSGCMITTAMLDRLGVSVAKQERTLFTGYHNWICTLARAGATSAALSLATDMFRSSRWEYVETSSMAEVLLVTASLYRRQGRLFRSLMPVSRALMMRPALAGRPLKRLTSGLLRRFA